MESVGAFQELGAMPPEKAAVPHSWHASGKSSPGHRPAAREGEDEDGLAARGDEKGNGFAEPLILWGLVLVSTAVFWLTNLDMTVMRWAYAGGEKPWPLADHPVWDFLYHQAPWIGGVLLLGSVLVLVLALFVSRLKRYRLVAWFVFLALAIGPGLLVNVLFKQHWGRPRPRQLVEFGGNYEYVPPLAFGDHGRCFSFPAGHAAVGFSYVVFWFVLRRTRPRLAVSALLGGCALGTVMGVGRMLEGGHFPSDVLWSGLLVYASCCALHHVLFGRTMAGKRVGLRARLGVRGYRWFQLVVYAALVSATLFCLLLATPKYRILELKVDPKDWRAVSELAFHLDVADVSVFVIQGSDQPLFMTGEARGFGLPTNRVIQTREKAGDGWVFRLQHQGLFSELETRLELLVPEEAADKVRIVVQRGSVTCFPPSQVEVTVLEGEVGPHTRQ